MSRSDGTPPAQAPRRPLQPPLFELGTDGRLRGHVALVPDLTPDSSLEIARYWYRRAGKAYEAYPDGRQELIAIKAALTY